jgi:TonB-linked SusC/RagA family outer membrane protein
MKKTLLLFLLALGTLTLPAQQQKKATTFVMKGIVVDEAGEPFEGVTIYVKDKISIGTQSDSKGAFSIKAVKGDIIVFDFLGLAKVEYMVMEEDQNMRIELKEQAEQLDEVVVTALGSQRKVSNVGAISTVDAAQLQVPAPSVANMLGGKVAGIITMQTSGEPGQNLAEFWVRGIGTFGASTGALVLIDGLEGNINSIDPADIESFSVLKDASATAVYGVRGANGVVIITTKKGAAGKLQISGRANFTVSQLKRLPEYLRAYEYASLMNEALEVRGADPRYNPLQMHIIERGLDRDMYPDVSWQDEILNPTSFKQTYYASARAGGEIARYFVSLGMSNETAAYKTDDNVYSSNVGYNTYNYRINVNMSLTKTTEVYFGADGYLSIRKEPGITNTDYIWWAQSMLNPLMFPTVYSNGMLPAGGGATSGLASPYVMVNYMGKSQEEEYRGKATLAVNQNLDMILEGLKIKIQGAYDLTSFHNEQRLVMPALYRAFERDLNGELRMREITKEQKAIYGRGQDRFRKYHFESNLNYDHLFGKDHRVSALVYYYLSDQQATRNNNTSMRAIPVRYQGVSSRLTYNFRDTYMIDFNFGYTGSENFQPGRQYGFFPSVALGWVPTAYQFVKDKIKWLSFLKIRGSYGTVGNDRIAGDQRFPYLTLLNNNLLNTIWGAPGYRETVTETFIGANNLQWEKAQKADLGLEGRLFNDRVSFVVDIFSDMRNGIFQQRIQVPAYAGAITAPYGNVGKMRSFGTDGNVEYKESIGKNITFTLRGNFTYSNNMIYNWEQLIEKYPYIENTGYPNGVHRGYRSMGLFKNEDEIRNSPRQTFGAVMPGDIRYEDVNGDGKVDSEDRVPLSYGTFPPLMYGFGGEIRYKNFSIGVLLKGTGKTDYYHVGQWINGTEGNNGMGYVPFHGGEAGNVLTIAADPHNRWIPKEYALSHGIPLELAENPNAMFPRLQYGYNGNNSQLSDFWKGDSRYLRLQEITLSYNLKHDVLRRVGIAGLDIQLVGNNLITWDKVKMFDPEQAQRNGRVYPIPAVYTLQLYIHL